MKVNLKENIVINNQLLPNNITNESVLKLFRLIDKVSFFDEVDKSMANVDDNFFFNEKRFMLKNSIIGKLLNLIVDSNYSNALNVGSGTGFTSAILSQISSFVISLESDKSLHEKEKKNLKIHEIENVKSVNEKLNNGYKNSMPYDLIFINGCLSESPKIFLDQLDSVGRLVCIESIDFNIKKIVQYFKKSKILERKEYYIVNAPLLL
jgi:protein-L-isoaspartate(D-aspartate) O-methyltransferase|tara:strand:- start:772 stop:1395 length:624 start_codon:yes stop_codon:yes gene_type:complete